MVTLRGRPDRQTALQALAPKESYCTLVRIVTISSGFSEEARKLITKPRFFQYLFQEQKQET